MCENYDPLFGCRGPVGQKSAATSAAAYLPTCSRPMPFGSAKRKYLQKRVENKILSIFRQVVMTLYTE